MPTSLILVYGRDQRLLETRSWVLEQAGYGVVSAMRWNKAETLASSEPLDLAVLCHSLSTEETQAALAALRQLRPKVQRLVLTVGTTAITDGQQEAVLSAYDGPRKLLEAVERLSHGDAPQ